MRSGKRFVPFMLVFSGIILLLFLIMQPLQVWKYQNYIAVLFPKGSIGLEERNLLFIIQGVMLLVVLPVFLFTFIFSWKYSIHNPKGKYDPDLIDNKLAEVFWWGIPLVLTLFIGILTWQKTHELDPYKPIQSDKKPLTIQAVALQWKWLFLYPEEKIACVNFVHIPTETPIHFLVTADAPMNSLWIPALGGQIYAMPGMRTELNLIAHEGGDFRGSSANISGEHFADMYFITRSSSREDFDKWVNDAKKSDQSFGLEEYNQLAKPSVNDKKTFALEDDRLFEKVIKKYTHPQE